MEKAREAEMKQLTYVCDQMKTVDLQVWFGDNSRCSFGLSASPTSMAGSPPLPPLPDEIWIDILGMLNPDELASCALVCKEWRRSLFLLKKKKKRHQYTSALCSNFTRLANEEALWKELTVRTFHVDPNEKVRGWKNEYILRHQAISPLDS